MSSPKAMDDAVSQRPAPTPIPVLSPALHCVAMTALVYLRTSFGYAFLRPRSVFFVFSWAFVLFAIFAWHYPLIWSEYRAVCIFGTGAAVLYCIHFCTTFSREWRRQAEDDPYPGTSHALRLSRQFGFQAFPEEILRFWIEPAAVVFVALVLRFVFGERHLSAWLIFVAACMVGREGINHWTTARKEKVFGEGFRKAKQQADSIPDDKTTAPPPKQTRKEAVKQKRNPEAATDPEVRYARILRLRPPYTLENAEENFRTLIRLEHPDGHENSPESNAAAVELNDAIAFFREKFSA